MRDVGDSAPVANQVARSTGSKLLVEHTVKPAGLVLVSRDTIRDFLGGVAVEVVGLALEIGPASAGAAFYSEVLQKPVKASTCTQCLDEENERLMKVM